MGEEEPGNTAVMNPDPQVTTGQLTPPTVTANEGQEMGEIPPRLVRLKRVHPFVARVGGVMEVTLNNLTVALNDPLERPLGLTATLMGREPGDTLLLSVHVMEVGDAAVAWG